MQRALVIDPGKCTGCKQCELACSYENEGVFNPAKSRIRVFDFHQNARFVPYTCTQCDEAWCQQACPTDAIVFGNLDDPNSRVSQMAKSERAYRVLEELGTEPRVTYLTGLKGGNSYGG